MNQILMTEETNNPRQNNTNLKKPIQDINKIVLTFAIIIITFGLALTGISGYSLANTIKENKNASVPNVTATRKGNQIEISVKDETAIKYIKYSWNNSNEISVNAKNKTEFKTTINIISGNNKLNIKVVDVKNKVTQYVKNYIQDEKDTTEPEITITNEDPKLKITVTDDTALDYIVYKYGDNAEVKVEANTEDPTKIEAYVENLLTSQVTLHIEAVDKAQNTKTYDQEVKGVKKPTITVTPDEKDPSYLIIKVNDEDGLQRVVYYINDQEYSTNKDVSLSTKEFVWRQKVEKGTSNVKVNAYSLTEQVGEFLGIDNY